MLILNLPQTPRDFHSSYGGKATALEKVSYISRISSSKVPAQVRSAALKSALSEEGALLAQLGSNHDTLSEFHFSVARLAGLKKSVERVWSAASHAARGNNWKKAYQIFEQAKTPERSLAVIAELEGERGLMRALQFAKGSKISQEKVAAALKEYPDFSKALLAKLDPISSAKFHALAHQFDAVVALANAAGNPVDFARKLLSHPEPQMAVAAATVLKSHKKMVGAGTAFAEAAVRYGLGNRSAVAIALANAAGCLRGELEPTALKLLKGENPGAGAMLFYKLHGGADKAERALQELGYPDAARALFGSGFARREAFRAREKDK